MPSLRGVSDFPEQADRFISWFSATRCGASAAARTFACGLPLVLISDFHLPSSVSGAIESFAGFNDSEGRRGYTFGNWSVRRDWRMIQNPINL